jgi:hypothetical protein
MAAWALVVAFSAFRYSAVSKRIEVDPVRHESDFHTTWAVAGAWGTARYAGSAGDHTIEWAVSSGQVDIREISFPILAAAPPSSVTVSLDGSARPSSFGVRDGRAAVQLESELSLCAGHRLELRYRAPETAQA